VTGRFENEISVILMDKILDLVVDSGASQLEVVSAIEAVKAILPSLPISLVTATSSAESES
jgi:hypothetical protein